MFDRLAGRRVVAGARDRLLGRGHRDHHGRRWRWRGRLRGRRRLPHGRRRGLRCGLGWWWWWWWRGRRRGRRRLGRGCGGRRGGLGGRCGLRGGGRGRGGRGLGRARRWRGWRRAGRVVVMTPAVVAARVVPVALAVAVSVAGISTISVISATPIAPGRAVGGGRDQGEGTRPLTGVVRRVGVAIGHGRCGRQRGPQQDRDRQQPPGRGSFHPGSMGSRTPAQSAVGSGSPERVIRWLWRFKPASERDRSVTDLSPKGICRFRSIAGHRPVHVFDV